MPQKKPRKKAVSFRKNKQKKVRIYPPINSLEMANGTDVCSLTLSSIPAEFIESYHSFYLGDLQQCIDGFGLALNKEECIEISAFAEVRGANKHSGKKLWQLPTNVLTQIKSNLNPIEVVL
jgi:hypothetical protein